MYTRPCPKPGHRRLLSVVGKPPDIEEFLTAKAQKANKEKRRLIDKQILLKIWHGIGMIYEED
jgi:hypothetical protein